MKHKPITPYAHLLKQFSEFCDKVFYRHKRFMFFYKKEVLRTGFTLDDLYQRTAAAQQIGYQVIVEAADDGLRTYYVRQLPDRPWNV